MKWTTVETWKWIFPSRSLTVSDCMAPGIIYSLLVICSPTTALMVVLMEQDNRWSPWVFWQFYQSCSLHILQAVICSQLPRGGNCSAHYWMGGALLVLYEAFQGPGYFISYTVHVVCMEVGHIRQHKNPQRLKGWGTQIQDSSRMMQEISPQKSVQ